jgi:drug/metabolite transporter (DMT)-like permease
MLAIISALVSFLGWGIGDIFNTIATRKIGSFNASFYGYSVGLVLSIFYIPFALNTLHFVNLKLILLTSFLTLLQVVAFFAYNEGLKIGSASLVGTIAGSFTSLVVIFSLIFFGEKLVLTQIYAIIVTFLGLLLSSIHFSDFRNKKALVNKGNIMAFIAMLGWSIYFTFIKIPVREAGFFWPTLITNIVGTLVFLIIGLHRIKWPALPLQKGFVAVITSGLLLTIGSFGFNFAIGNGLSSIVAPIAGAYPALFALLAYIIFKDPITNQQKIGMILTLCGIILLAYFSR